MFINIHTHQLSQENNDTITLFNLQYPPRESVPADKNILLSYGIHPWQLNDLSHHDIDALFDELTSALQNNLPAAIGECGMDRAIDADFSFQQTVFIKQAKLAEQYHLPLIIHCVRAYPELISIAGKIKPTVPWIIHQFSGNNQQLRQLLKFNFFFISFGPMIIQYPDKYRELLQLAFQKRKMLLETDDSNITIKAVYNHAALLLDISVDVLEENIRHTYKQVQRFQVPGSGLLKNDEFPKYPSTNE